MTPAQDQFGLDDLEFGLDEVGVISQGGRGLHQGLDVRLVALDFDAGGAGVGLRQYEGYQRGGDDDQEEDGEDDGLADADNPPIIQEVEFGFLGRGDFQWIHNTRRLNRKGGLAVTAKPPSMT